MYLRWPLFGILTAMSRMCFHGNQGGGRASIDVPRDFKDAGAMDEPAE
jgi:hypothetical protein